MAVANIFLTLLLAVFVLLGQTHHYSPGNGVQQLVMKKDAILSRNICSLPFCPKVKVECSAKQEEGACVDHECLWVGVEGGIVKLAHGNAGCEWHNCCDDGHCAEYLAHLVRSNTATE